MDKISVEEKSFHKSCFRCHHCNQVMSLGNFAAMNGTYYCKPHFKQLFKLKGNYDEGFGREQHKTKWGGSDSEGATPNPGTPTTQESESSGNAAAPDSVAVSAELPVTPGTPATPATPSDLNARKVKTQSLSSPKISVASEKCPICSQTVYPMDKISVEEKSFHKSCFRCASCKNVLSLGNFAALEGQYYCKPHFKQLFQLKGNYDEGFGREQHKKHWVDSESPAP